MRRWSSPVSCFRAARAAAVVCVVVVGVGVGLDGRLALGLLEAGELLLRDGEGVVGGRHTEVDGRLEEDLLDLLDGQAIASSRAYVHGELVPVVAGDERGQRDCAAHATVEPGA